MLSDYIVLLPEILLLLGMTVLTLVRLLRSGNSPRTYYIIGRNFLLAAALSAALFYNQGVDGRLMNNYFTTLFQMIVYLFVLVWNYLSLKHFQSKKRSSYTFYLLVMLNVLGFSIALSAENLWLLYAGLVPPFVLNYFMLAIGRDEDADVPCRRVYLAGALIMALLFAAAIAVLQHYSGGCNYQEVEQFLEEDTAGLWQCRLSFVLIMCALFYMLGLAPLHFWRAEVISRTIVPVSGFLTIVPIFAYLSCQIDVMINVFYPYSHQFAGIMQICGCLSVFFGALVCNGENNLRRMFAHIGLCYSGVLVIALSEINDQSLLSSFIYLLVYALTICGIYTVFLGIRSKGVYLSELKDIRGLATQRPFVAAAFLLFMISLIGMPPLLGFLGKLSIAGNLVANYGYVMAAVVMASVLLLANAGLRVITALYFEPRNISFDRVDKGVYICLLINMLLILIAILNPRYLMHDVETMLVTVL